MVRSIRIVKLLGLFLLLFSPRPIEAQEKAAQEKNVLIIGRSSLAGLHELVGALLKSNKTPMNAEAGHFGAKQ